ncbi:maleylacetoacetate isomerase [Denitratisoma sp. agr-D3]
MRTFIRAMTMPQTPTFTLHGFWRSSASYRVRAALKLKGLAYEEKAVDLSQAEHRSADYLALNPQGALPTLVLPGHPPLTQSLAILEFLDEFQPTPALLPGDIHQRAWVRSLAGLLVSDTHPLITPRILGFLRRQGEVDDERWRDWQTHWFHTGLTAFEQRLVQADCAGDTCLGTAAGMADICLVSIFAVMASLAIAPPEAVPRCRRIVDHCLTLPAFAEAWPFNQPGAPRPG